MLAVASIASPVPTAQANPMHSTAISARGTAFAPCPTSFAGIDPILLKHKQNIDRNKARLCARGFQQPAHDIGNKYAPVGQAEMVRCMLAIAVRMQWSVEGWDVRNAYSQAPVPRDTYIQPPPRQQRPGYCLRLNRALYGLPGSGRAWFKEYDSYLQTLPVARSS